MGESDSVWNDDECHETSAKKKNTPSVLGQTIHVQFFAVGLQGAGVVFRHDQEAIWRIHTRKNNNNPMTGTTWSGTQILL